MSEQVTVSSSSSIGPGTLLFLVFLVLKLTHVISWSWWWVTAPLWGSFALFLLFGVIGIVAFIWARKRFDL